MAYLNDFIYVLGGKLNGEITKTCEVLSIENGGIIDSQWKSISPMHYPRSQLSVITSKH
jgi:hypothetical protein